MEKLKNCPFCGASANYISVTRVMNTRGYVECSNVDYCGASVPGGGSYTERAKAIEWWNRRTKEF